MVEWNIVIVIDYPSNHEATIWIAMFIWVPSLDWPLVSSQ